jgi:signal transduction histidine kinase
VQGNPPPTSTENNNRPQSRWGIFLFFITPIYGAAAWLLINFGIPYLRLSDSHEDLTQFYALFVYVALAVVWHFSLSISIRKKIPARRGEPLAVRLAEIRQGSRAFTDEIDMLVTSMRTMLANLERQKVELLESREKMQELTRTTLRAQESERRYIARELHGEAGQLLISLQYAVDSLLSDLEAARTTPADAPLEIASLQERLFSMRAQITSTLGTVRGLSHKMRPALLDVGDINLAMQEYCGEFQHGKHLVINYNGTSLPFLEDEAAVSLFRFLQEALTNVLKHADATSVTVHLLEDDGWIKMSVEDNGRGEAADASPPGIGIAGMKERFHLLGGTVEATSTSDGFLITAKFPLPNLPVQLPA